MDKNSHLKRYDRWLLTRYARLCTVCSTIGRAMVHSMVFSMVRTAIPGQPNALYCTYYLTLNLSQSQHVVGNSAGMIHKFLVLD